MKNILVLYCLFLVMGCATPNPDKPVYYKNVKVVPGAVRTVCIQPDPAQPQLAMVVKPLEEKLTARGYQVVATPGEAAHTIRLRLTRFGPNYKPRSGKVNATGIIQETGEAIGGAASGRVLHAVPSPEGQAIGSGAGMAAGVVWNALDAASRGIGPKFYTLVDVRISDPAKGEQHTDAGNIWTLNKNYNDPGVRERTHQMMAVYLADKVAALLP